MTFTGDVSKLVAAPILQDYFVDKTTGLPLSAGIVSAFHDNARQTYKNWYYQTGIPGAYTYVELPNPMTLSAVGTIQDPNGNDVIPFFYPWSLFNSTIFDPYYFTVVNSGLIPQFTRADFPFIGEGGGGDNTGGQDLVNLIPNGQFLPHNNIPATLSPATPAGQVVNGSQAVAIITQGSTVYMTNTSVIVAQGGAVGWYFVKPVASTDIDTITFTLIGQEPETLTGNPRYFITVACTTTSGNDTFKELRMRFNNVNRFSSNSQQYTLSLQAFSNNSVTNIMLNEIKYFGVGGSAPTEVTLDTYSVQTGTWDTAAGTIFSTSFVFGSNDGFTIGTGDDDYMEIAIAFLPDETFSISLTDVYLTPGIVVPTAYPEQNDSQVLAVALAGSVPVPNPDGSDLYLPMILTPGGMTWDTSQIGTIVGKMTVVPVFNELFCDGTQYPVNGYSAIGIPYRRLFNALYNPTEHGPIFGAGASYVSSLIQSGNTGQFILSTNQGGLVTTPANGGVSPAFVISPLALPSTTFSYNAYASQGGLVTAIMINTNYPLSHLGIDAGNSGMICLDTTNPALTGVVYGFTIQALVASALSAGSMQKGLYFDFSNASTRFRFWFSVAGEVTPDNPSAYTLQVINLVATMGLQDVANAIAQAINGHQSYAITASAASAIPAGAYFTFNTTGTQYTVWYKKDGVGTAPIGGTNPIEVDIAAADDVTDVAESTVIAINAQYFCVPNLQGYFLRGFDPSQTVDLGGANRYPYLPGLSASSVGTYELSNNLAHEHAASFTFGQTLNGAGGIAVRAVASPGADTQVVAVAQDGLYESRPVNVAVSYFIKY